MLNVKILLLIYTFDTFSNLDMFTLKSIEINFEIPNFLKIGAYLNMLLWRIKKLKNKLKFFKGYKSI